jgi:hypothetical protein
MNVNPTSDTKTLREFGLVFGAMVGGLFGLLFPWLFDRAWPLWPWIVAVVAVSWALIAPSSLAPVYRAWMKLGHGLGWVNTRIILSLLYYLVFTPVGLLMRLFGKDPMRREWLADEDSYRVASRRPPAKSMENPF